MWIGSNKVMDDMCLYVDTVHVDGVVINELAVCQILANKIKVAIQGIVGFKMDKICVWEMAR